MKIVTHPTKVASTLKAVAKAKGLSTRQISAKTGVSKSTVQELMHSDVTGQCPSMFTVVKLASGLGVARRHFLP